MALDTLRRRDNPTWRILEHLQRAGSATIKDLEQLLGVTTTAVRQHLNSLENEGYVERRRVYSGVGRPHHAYSITDKVRELFACHCDDLALTLLEEVLEVEGKERTALHKRVEELADALYAQGILTDVVERDGDILILKTYNCPYHELAQEHREVCEMDQHMLRTVLGSDVSLSACMMDGHAGCSFVVAKHDGGLPGL